MNCLYPEKCSIHKNPTTYYNSGLLAMWLASWWAIGLMIIFSHTGGTGNKIAPESNMQVTLIPSTVLAQGASVGCVCHLEFHYLYETRTYDLETDHDGSTDCLESKSDWFFVRIQPPDYEGQVAAKILAVNGKPRGQQLRYGEGIARRNCDYERK